jgi:ribose 1,5-bisphosphate isomerase
MLHSTRMLPDRLRASLRGDSHSGAAEIAQRAARELEAHVALLQGRGGRALRRELAELCRQLLAAQPAMSPLLALGAAAVCAVPEDAGEEEALAAARAGLRAFAERLATASRKVAERAQALIPAGGQVFTLSQSSTVRQTLLAAAGRRSFEVVCLEGRPNLEGRALAAALAAARIPVRLAVDAAAAGLVDECDVVLVGADSIGDAGFVNKIGTRALALYADHSGTPLYVLADWTKVLPRGWPQWIDDDRPADEVWQGAPPGIRIRNRYFEATPLTLATGVISGSGLCTPAELEERRAAVHLPPELLPDRAR